MANEIQWRGTETGVTLYATIRSATGTQWNTAGTPNFEAVTAANWADYDVALAESTGNYFYVGTFPAISGNMVAGWYWVDVYKRAGGTPAITDTLQGTIVGYWNGTSLLPWASQLGPVTHTGAVVPTVTTLTGHTPQTGDCYARLGAPAGASHAADVAAVKADTAAILDDTGTSGVLLANGSIKTGTFNAGAINAAAIAADAIGASELAADAVTEIVAGVWGALTASYTGIGTFGLLLSSTNNAAQTINGDWTDGQRLDLILDAIKAKTDAMLDATAVANAVWDASQASHVGAGTFGLYVDAKISEAGGGGLTAAAIADAVWDELATGHIDTGKAGAQLWTVINTLTSGSAINITSTNTVIESE